MALLSTKSLTKEYDKSIDKIFYGNYKEAPREFDKVFKIWTAGKELGGVYTESELSGLGALQVKKEGTGVTFTSPTEGNEVSRTPTIYALGFQLTMEANQDDLHGNWKKMPAELSKSASLKRETVAFDLFNDGFATHTGWDGQYIFDASGRTLLGDTGTTQNNRPSSDVSMSETGLQAMFQYFKTVKDSVGRPVMATPKMVLYPIDLMWTANVLSKTVGKPGSMDNDINTIKDYASGVTFMPSRHLTSATAWFGLADIHDFNFVWFMPATLDSWDEPGTRNALYAVFMRFMVYMNNPIGCWGTTGA
jgi:hypothetical protein